MKLDLIPIKGKYAYLFLIQLIYWCPNFLIGFDSLIKKHFHQKLYFCILTETLISNQTFFTIFLKLIFKKILIILFIQKENNLLN